MNRILHPKSFFSSKAIKYIVNGIMVLNTTIGGFDTILRYYLLLLVYCYYLQFCITTYVLAILYL